MVRFAGALFCREVSSESDTTVSLEIDTYANFAFTVKTGLLLLDAWVHICLFVFYKFTGIRWKICFWFCLLALFLIIFFVGEGQDTRNQIWFIDILPVNFLFNIGVVSHSMFLNKCFSLCFYKCARIIYHISYKSIENFILCVHEYVVVVCRNY